MRNVRQIPAGWVARALLLVWVLTCVACGPAAMPEAGAEPLTIGVLPDETATVLKARYEPLLEHLAGRTGLRLELEIPDSYDALVQSFDEGRIQLAWFGGLTFLRAERRSGALPLVMRDVDMSFTSDFLVARSREEQSLLELAGLKFAFGPRMSTSGHLMPRHHLRNQGIEPEVTYSTVLYSDGHDQTAQWVEQRKVDVGAVNSVVVESMFADGRLSGERVRVLQTTAPYRNYVWAVRPDVPSEIRIALQDAFLGLDAAIPDEARILEAQHASFFVPASGSDYADLRQAAELIGLFDDESR